MNFDRGAFDLFQKTRDLYLTWFEEVIRDQGDVILEPELRTEDGEVATCGRLDLPLRADFIQNHPPSSFHVGLSKSLSFESFAFPHRSAKIVVEPFTWEAVSVSCDIDLAAMESALVDWFPKAFEEKTEGNPFFECVHFASDPEQNGETVFCEIDLGSSKAEVLVHLLDMLIEKGANRISVYATEAE